MDKEPESAGNHSALVECTAVRKSIAAKADRHKRRARVSTIFLTVSTAAVPVLIGLSGDDFVWGKAVPSIMSALSAVGAAIVSLERPHERWSLYRRYQRMLEGEEMKYRFLVEPYTAENKDRQLAMETAQLQLNLHDEWSGLIPAAKELANIRAERSR